MRWEEPLTGADGLNGEVAQRIWVDQFDEELFIQTSVGYHGYNRLFDRWYSINEVPRVESNNQHLSAPDILLPSFDANYLGDGRFIDIYGRSYSSTDIVDDGSGTLWIGTWGFGPAMADRSSRIMELLDYGLLQNRVNVILPDDTILWLTGAVFSDYRTGLTAYNPETNSFFHVESGIGNSFPAEDVNCLEADEEQLYVGTPLGIYLVQRGSWTAGRPINRRRGLLDDNVLSLCLAGELLFVGTAGGLSFINMVTDSVSHVRPKIFLNQVIFDLETVGATIWIASSAGAYRYSIENARLQQYQDPDLVLFNEVYEIERFEDDLWLASDAGMVRLNLNTAESTPYLNFSHRTDSRALAVNNDIAAVASDKGLTIIFLKSEKQHSREFTTDDGLASGTIFSLFLNGDYIWVGTDRGLTRFLWNNPERVD
jgi:ligand-binding sensor domain-containing protein